MSIEELEENVTKAYHAKETWKSMRKRGLIPYTLEMEIKLTRELVKVSILILTCIKKIY